MDSIVVTYIRYAKLLDEKQVFVLQMDLMESRLAKKDLSIQSLSAQLFNMKRVYEKNQQRMSLIIDKHAIEVKILKRQKVKNYITGGVVGGVVVAILIASLKN